MFFLTIFLSLIALAAVYISWLEFPLSAALNAYEIAWNWQEYLNVSIGPIFQLCILFGCFFLLNGQLLIAMVFLSLALAQVLFMPWHVYLSHPDWLAGYIVESRERQQLYYFTQEKFVPNIISEPTYITIKQFETLFDQLGIAFQMLSIGWYVALFATCAILVVLLTRSKHYLRFIIVFALIISFGMLPNITSTIAQARAALAQHQGSQYLADNHATEALQAYGIALELNPALASSPTFLIKAADAFAMRTRGLHSSTDISKASIIIGQSNLLDSYTATSSSYRQARALLHGADENYFSSTEMEKALYQLRTRLVNQLWISEGLAEYQRGELHKAMQAFQQVTDDDDYLVARFFLATLYIRLNTPQLALDLLQPYLHQIAHPSIKADIYCTIGDAYARANDLLNARKAYISCTKSDNTKNYRATRALSGL
jgi:predicted negative regulator of RcsB-dependent stress response